MDGKTWRNLKRRTRDHTKNQSNNNMWREGVAPARKK